MSVRVQAVANGDRFGHEYIRQFQAGNVIDDLQECKIQAVDTAEVPSRVRHQLKIVFGRERPSDESIRQLSSEAQRVHLVQPTRCPSTAPEHPSSTQIESMFVAG